MDSVILTCGRCDQRAPRPRIEGMIVDPIGWTTITVSGTPIRTMRLCDRCAGELRLLLYGVGFAASIEERDPAATDALRTKVYEAIGSATMCWSEAVRAGVFDSTRAQQIGDELWSEIEKALSR